MSKILILDTETTGLTNHPVHGHPQVIELAYLDVSSITFKELKNFKTPGKLKNISELYKPSMEIHPEAIKVHGKTHEHLKGCCKSEELKLPEDIKYIIGHNISYDLRCLNMKDIQNVYSICTLNMIRQYRKIADLEVLDNKLDTLISHFFPEESKQFQTEFHSALGDCYKVVLLLLKFEEFFPNIITWDDLFNLQNKFKGKK